MAPRAGTRMVTGDASGRAARDGDRPALLAVCALGIAHAGVYTNHAPLIPILRADLGFGAGEAGLLSSVFFASSAAIMIPAGLLGDRIGPKRVALAGLLVLGAATMALWWARGLGDLLLLKAVAGTGAGSTFVSGTRYASTRFVGGAAQVALGLYGGAIQLGTGLAIYLMPVAAGALGWRGAFVLSGLVCWLAALVWARTPPVVGGRAPSLRDAVGRRSSWLLGTVQLATFGVGIVVGTWATVYFMAEHGLALGAASLLGSLVLGLGVAARPLGGVLLARRLLTAVRSMRACLLLTLLGLALMAAPGRPLGLAVAGLVLVGIGVSLPYAAVFGTAAATLPTSPGAVQGLVGMLSLVAIVLATPVVGWAFERTGGFVVPLAVLGGVVLGGLAASLALRVVPPGADAAAPGRPPSPPFPGGAQEPPGNGGWGGRRRPAP